MQVLDPYIVYYDGSVRSTSVVNVHTSEYDGAHTYALGDIVLLPASDAGTVTDEQMQRYWRCLQGPCLDVHPVNGGTGGAAALYWADAGPQEVWAPFALKNSKTTRKSTTGALTYTFEAAATGACLAVTDVEGAAVTVQALSVTSTVLYSRSKTLGDFAENFVATDIPVSTADSVVVSVTHSTGRASKIGKIVFGDLVSLGAIEAGATLGTVDYSVKKTDVDGNVTLEEKPDKPTMQVRALFKNSDLTRVYGTLRALRATVALWFGADPANSDFEVLTFLGFIREHSIEIAYKKNSLMSVQVEGV
jgi:hypothetical protein